MAVARHPRLIASIVAAALFASGVLFATATRPLVVPAEHAGVILLQNDPGGNVDDHVKWYARLARSRIPVRIAGECNSACTFVLKLPPSQVCMTRGSTLGFHVASTDGKPDRKVTRRIVHEIYPKPVRDWIRANGPLQQKVKPMSAKTAIALGVVKACA